MAVEPHALVEAVVGLQLQHAAGEGNCGVGVEGLVQRGGAAAEAERAADLELLGEVGAAAADGVAADADVCREGLRAALHSELAGALEG